MLTAPLLTLVTNYAPVRSLSPPRYFAAGRSFGSSGPSQGEMESLGRLLAWDEFSLEDLATRLSSAQWRADEEFAAYGLTEAEILDLKRWAQSWADDINQRIYRDAADEDKQ